MWGNIPWKVRNMITERIMRMPECDRKLIVSLAFIDEMSTTDIAYYCADYGIYSRNHQPYSRRRIQQIIAEEVPEYNQYQKKRDRAEKRKQHFRILDMKEKSPCARCGATGSVELHHMIPLFLGGSNDDANLIWLCKECHKDVTAYQREKFKNEWYDGVR